MNKSYQGYSGVLGGSFDPPHIGHIFMVEYALTVLGMRRVYVVPCADHPFGKQISPFEHRAKMCRDSFHGKKGVLVSAIENTLPKPSYTVNTIEELQKQNPSEKFVLLLGSDQITELHKWKSFKKLQSMASILIFKRGEGAQETSEFDYTAISFPAVSSTQIRKIASEGGDFSTFVAAPIFEYIERKRLYLRAIR